MRYTESLAEAGVVASVGSYDALAEYIDWSRFRRLHGEIGLIPPVESEDLHRSTAPAQRAAERQVRVSIQPGT